MGDREQAIALGHNGWDAGIEASEQSAEKSGNMVISPLLPVPKTGGSANLKSFQRGVSGNPKGRPRKEVETEIQEAIYKAASPERIEDVMNRLYQHIVDYGGYKAAEAYLKLALPYTLGNPNQRIIHEDSALAGILAAIRAARNPE